MQGILILFTLIFFILIIPGYLFRKLYFREQFSKQFKKSNQFEVLIANAYPSIILYIICIIIVYPCGYAINIKILLSSFLNSKEAANDIIKNIDAHSIKIIQFHLLLYGMSIILGLFFRFIVLFFKLDRKYKLFRFDNHWHYMVTGKVMDFKRCNIPKTHQVEEIKFTYVSALSEISQGLILYEGMLAEYELNRNNELDLIHLTQVERSFICDSAIKNTPFSTNSCKYTFPQHVLVLKYSELKNIHFSYYGMKEKDGKYQVYEI